MSNESLESSASAATSRSPTQQQGRTPVPDILRHQKSFEQRYSHIIHRQILETSINKEELQRQMNAFFPFSRSSSLQCEAGVGAKESTTELLKSDMTESTSSGCSSSSTDQVNEETQRSLQKLETLDIADKEAISSHK